MCVGCGGGGEQQNGILLGQFCFIYLLVTHMCDVCLPPWGLELFLNLLPGANCDILRCSLPAGACSCRLEHALGDQMGNMVTMGLKSFCLWCP